MKKKKRKGSGPIRRARKKEEEVRRSTCGIKKKKNTRKGKEEEDEHGFDEDHKDEDDEKDDETCTTKRTKRTKRSGPILRRAGLAQRGNKKMLRVGFEPTRPKPHELESCPLDHSGIVALSDQEACRRPNLKPDARLLTGMAAPRDVGIGRSPEGSSSSWCVRCSPHG